VVLCCAVLVWSDLDLVTSHKPTTPSQPRLKNAKGEREKQAESNDLKVATGPVARR